MGVEQQQGGFCQRSLFEGLAENARPDQDGEARSLSVRPEEQQALTALDPARALTVNLMEEVTDRDNLNRAYDRVVANKGAAGVDGMTVGGLAAWIADHKDAFIAAGGGWLTPPPLSRGWTTPGSSVRAW